MNDSMEEQPEGAGVSHGTDDDHEVGEYGASFTQLLEKKGKVDESWILLDSQSRHSIFLTHLY